MKIVKLFIVNKNSDQTEGRGHLIPMFYCSNRDLAARIIECPAFYNQYGVQGCREGDYLIQEKEIQILDTFTDFSVVNKNAAVSKALGKLTKEDKEVLGL